MKLKSLSTPYKKIFRWYFSTGSLPYWCVLILDCLIVMFSGYIGNYLELGGIGFAQQFWQITAAKLISVLCFIVGFRLFHTYSGILRYSSVIDLERIGGANLVGILLYAVISRAISATGVTGVQFQGWLGDIILLCFTTLFMWFERMAVRNVYDSIKSSNVIPIAIYGTQAGGISLANSILFSHEKKYLLQAFISDHIQERTTFILGTRVLANGPDIAHRLLELKVKSIFISPLKSNIFRANEDMVNSLTAAGIKIYMMPTAEQWDGKSKLSHAQLHEVEIEDLLPRDPIQVDMEAIGAMLRGKRILITGAAGSIGSEMVRQVAKFDPAELILVDQAETPMHDVRLYMARNYPNLTAPTIVGSIANPTQMEAIFREHRPEYVFHAAAYKHVPMMEDNPAMAIQNNVYGTRVIADLAVKYGTRKFVMISTDKAVNPTNVMGCSKRICEIYCQSLNQAIQEIRKSGSQEARKSFPIEVDLGETPVTQFVTTRFGNVLGSNGSVIPIFREQIKKGGPVTVTHPDIIRFFMLIPEACQLVLEAGTMGKGGEIFVFDMGKPVKIVDLAKRMIQLSGAKNIEIKFTGLRDGEKLYEEVLNDEEGTRPTVHPKIKVAQVREYPYTEALQNERDLYDISFTYDDMAIVKKMKEIVPEYKSKVSKYEILDKPCDNK